MTGPATPGPGPARPGSWLPGPAPAAVADEPAGEAGELALRLAALPVGEHAALLEAEHERLHRRLATIDSW